MSTFLFLSFSSSPSSLSPISLSYFSLLFLALIFFFPSLMFVREFKKSPRSKKGKKRRRNVNLWCEGKTKKNNIHEWIELLFSSLFSWKGRKEERKEERRREREKGKRASPSIFKRNFSSLPFVVNQNLLDMFFLSPSFFESVNWKRNKLERERERERTKYRKNETQREREREREKHKEISHTGKEKERK